MRTTLLVTGGLGFIGWEVCTRALERGWWPIALDNLSGNVVTPAEAEANGVPALTCDLHAGVPPYPVLRAVQEAIRWTDPDAPSHITHVVHCAAPVGAAGVLGRDCVAEVVGSTMAAMRLAYVLEAPLLNISSSEVYGVPGVNTEGDPCVIPGRFSDRLTYAVGKLAAEHMMASGARRNGLRAISVRPFNVVGHRQSAAKGFVLPRFLEAALAGDPLTVFGDGTQRRAFTPVADLAEFLLDLTDSPHVWDGRVLNVGAEENETSVLELAELVRHMVAHHLDLPPAPIVLTDGREVFGTLYEEASAGTKLPDAAAARALGWAPRRALGDVIGDALAELAPEVA